MRGKVALASEAIARGAPFWIEYYFEADETHPRGYRVVTPFRADEMGGIAMRDEDRESGGCRYLRLTFSECGGRGHVVRIAHFSDAAVDGVNGIATSVRTITPPSGS